MGSQFQEVLLLKSSSKRPRQWFTDVGVLEPHLLSGKGFCRLCSFHMTHVAIQQHYRQRIKKASSSGESNLFVLAVLQAALF